MPYRAGPGRPKGAPNKATRAIKEIAEPFGEAAVGVLAAIMTDPLAPHPARVAAATGLLDRGFGKPHQTQDMTVNGTRSFVIAPETATREEWDAICRKNRELVAENKRPMIDADDIAARQRIAKSATAAKIDGSQKPSIQ